MPTMTTQISTQFYAQTCTPRFFFCVRTAFHVVTVDEGNITLSSTDGVDYRIHQGNVDLICRSFPSDPLGLATVSLPVHSSVLFPALHFLYPNRQIPNLRALSFEKLKELFFLVSEWGMPQAQEFVRVYLQQVCFMFFCSSSVIFVVFTENMPPYIPRKSYFSSRIAIFSLNASPRSSLIRLFMTLPPVESQIGSAYDG
jgi:hypothetical protein